MKYENVVEGKFIDRPNRFIAHVAIEGKQETVHVKNTGRCRELLSPGATVYLEKGGHPGRKTAYDLISVRKGNRLVNMDSQAPNKAVHEWLLKKQLFPDLCFVRPETTYGGSRFDFYIETAKEKIFMEVKGVTLEDNGVMRFPDAPSERAIKHVEELIRSVSEGYRAYILFVIQMKGANYFTPHREMHPDFARALEEAEKAGVTILAYDCEVTPECMEIAETVPVKLKEDVLSDIPKPLLRWYDENRRVLPWREEPTPYHVWISEIMLQQTRVEAVKPYFKRFMEELPDIRTLAYAEEDKLLKLWEGLGYYNRARNLQKAALQIEEEYGGNMPGEYEELLKLKGIGSYTAGAISSIAFRNPYPAVDGNVLRVVSRLREDPDDIAAAGTKKKVEADLAGIIPKDRPGDFNQAMMEIGAMVCLPNGAPKCGECPLNGLCRAYISGTQTQYPVKAAKKQRSVEKKTILVIRDENRAAICKRPAKGLLAGMYEFPAMEGHCSAREVISYLKEKGLATIRIQRLADSKHIFSHKEWHMIGYVVRVDELSDPGGNKPGNWLFIEPEETEKNYPIPSAYGAYTDYLNIKLGNGKYKS